MLRRRLNLRLVAFAAFAVALAWPLASQQAFGRTPGLNLDALDDSALDRILQAELDFDDLAACGLTDPRAAIRNEDMVEIIICALEDDGDDDFEDDVDFDDFEAEMAEAGTSVRQVVQYAMVQADAFARLPANGQDDDPMAAAFALDSHPGFPPEAGGDPRRNLAAANGYINPASVAVRFAKAGMRNGVRAVQR